MRKIGHYDMEDCGLVCPTVYTLDLIQRKWRIPVLYHIDKAGSIHYNELKRKMPLLSDTVLMRCLKEFEENGVLSRVDYQTNPPSVEYSLTDDGRELLGMLDHLYEWGARQLRKKGFSEERIAQRI